MVVSERVFGYGVGQFPTFWLGPLTTGEPNREIHIAFQAPDSAIKPPEPALKAIEPPSRPVSSPASV